MDENQWIEKLKNEGYTKIEKKTFPPNKDFGIHTHDEHTIQVILKGELIIDENGAKREMKEGERVEFSPGTSHSTKCGADGCEFIVGFRS